MLVDEVDCLVGQSWDGQREFGARFRRPRARPHAGFRPKPGSGDERSRPAWVGSVKLSEVAPRTRVPPRRRATVRERGGVPPPAVRSARGSRSTEEKPVRPTTMGFTATGAGGAPNNGLLYCSEP